MRKTLGNPLMWPHSFTFLLFMLGKNSLDVIDVEFDYRSMGLHSCQIFAVIDRNLKMEKKPTTITASLQSLPQKTYEYPDLSQHMVKHSKFSQIRMIIVTGNCRNIINHTKKMKLLYFSQVGLWVIYFFNH